ncbi:Mth938-like domain-containing protein [Aquimonas sp.]|jgi:uncharacterized protein|uniref:Mth938-like domain-containing protein n=1 Tax=Aquimonas sp. TaxID=1872588 RepID=UPI0037BE6D63
MPLAEERPEGLYAIRWVGDGCVRIDDTEFRSSLLVMPDRVWQDFPARVPGDLGAELISEMLALQPQVVILGTGARQVFPPPSVFAGFLTRGIGLEVMDNAAAARTYNLLALEGRRVAALLLLDPPEPG